MNTDPLVVLDAMGGDNAPGAIVEGAVKAARQLGVRIALVGRTEAIERELARLAPRPDPITIVDAPEVIDMDEHPAQAARQKKQSSIVVGLRMLKQREADAFVSAGNTGAVMAGAMLAANLPAALFLLLAGSLGMSGVCALASEKSRRGGGS